MSSKALPVVSVIGRPNVGKSSLYNRMLAKKVAVVHNMPGVTRDRNYRPCSWNGIDFMLVDTGGMVPNSTKKMEALIRRQVETAINESALILFVTDSTTGVTDIDLSIAGILKRSCGDKTIVVANKSESIAGKASTAEFYSLGLGEPFAVSALHGENVADLMDTISGRLKNFTAIDADAAIKIRVAVLGRPNVGKSSLVNALCREERMIVDDQPGTTRDAVDIVLGYDGMKYVLVDTAGLRKKARVKEDVEYYSNLRAVSSIDNCNVALIVLDAVITPKA